MKKVFSVILSLTFFALSSAFAFAGTVNETETISVSEMRSSAVKTDGSLWMWGNNEDGVFGSEYKVLNPIKIMDDVVSVNLGSRHSGAIKTDGSLWLWGDNWYGQLGYGYMYGYNSLVPVKIMDNVAAFSLGGSHSGAIKTDGSLWMWGRNLYGELGTGTNEYAAVPVKVMDNVKTISLGDSHSAAVKTDGTLWIWGYNWFGQLGIGTNVESNIPIKIMDDVASVILRDDYSAAIKTDGSLWVWGNNLYGQIGNGKHDRQSVNLPVKIMDNVVSVSLGTYNGAAITTDGSLWAWGSNSFKEFGNGTNKDSYVPVKIMDNIAAVSYGSGHGMVLKTDGTLWGSGFNKAGQLGVDTGTEETSDVFVKTMDNVKLPEVSRLQISTSPSDWAVGEINEATSAGLIPSDLQSGYKSPITRLDFCKLAFTLCQKVNGDIKNAGTASFNDISSLSTDEQKIISAINKLGIVNGYEDNTFRPYNQITRQEAAVMLMRTAKLLELEQVANSANIYDDCGDVSWAMEGIKYVCDAGIMNGLDSKSEAGQTHITFSPYTGYTREQAMITHYRLYKRL